MYYYTKTAQPSYLVIRPDEYMLFVRRGHEIALRKHGWIPGKSQAKEIWKKLSKPCFPDRCFQGKR